MAIQDDPFKKDLLELFTEMEAAPMSLDIYAAKLAAIIDKQIKTAEVQAGIPVKTEGTEKAQEGETTANGKVI